MKKYVLFMGTMVILLVMLSACGNKIRTYTYENEAVLEIRIKKTEVYPDRLVVTFAKDSLSGVEDVNCFQSDFSALEVEPEFSFAGDALTIETDDAARISGLRVWESDRDLYFDVRYLDSDSYAMLVSAWADDIGYMVNGDTDAYYTREEKNAQRELEEQQAESEAFAFSQLIGEWVNESGNTRIVFDVDESSGRYFLVSVLANGEWTEQEFMYITSLTERDTADAKEIIVYDNPAWGRAVSFYIMNDASGMECEYADEKFTRAEQEKPGFGPLSVNFPFYTSVYSCC